MMHKLTFRAMLWGGVCMLPLGALAADMGAAPAAPPAAAPVSENEIDLGLGGTFGTNTGQAGRYTGFTEDGMDGLFGFHSETRDGTRYYIFDGSNINFQFGNNLGTANVPVLVGSPTVNYSGTCSGAAASCGTSPTGIGTGVNGQIVNGHVNNFYDGNYQSQTNNDLGPNATVKFDVGDQGHWGIIGYYDAISYTGNIIDSIYTINGHTGTLNGALGGVNTWGGASLTAPGSILAYNAVAGGVPNSFNNGVTGAGTTNPAFPLSAEEPFQTGTRRDIVGLIGKYTWGDWTITGALRHEHKSGTVEESFDGAYGGTAFTLPIDYDTERYDVSAAYSTPQIQAVFGYFLSDFIDGNSGVSLPDPLSGANCTPSLTTSATNTKCVQANPYEMTAVYATPPSNYAQYVTAMIGYNLTPGTRFNLNARYGWETQNDAYPANTGDPAITYSGTNTTPGGAPPTAGGYAGGMTGLTASGFENNGVTSPNIMAQVFQGNVGVSTNPFTGFNASAKYSIDERDVSIGQPSGVYGNGTGMDSSEKANYAYVVPQEWLKQKVNLDADYKILPASNTKLTVAWEYDDIDRSNAQVGHSDTNIGTLGLSSMFGSSFMGRITGSYGERSGVLDYWTAWQNLTTGSPTFATGVDPSGAYYQAPMTLASVNLRGDYISGGPFSGGVSFKAENDDFHYPSATAGTPTGTASPNIPNQVEGIKSDYNLTAGIDGNYRLNEAVNFHAYYTYEQLFYDNIGNGDCANNNSVVTTTTKIGGVTSAPYPSYYCTGSAGYFQNKYTSGVSTLGLSAEFKATDRLKFTADYTFAYGSVLFGDYNGVFVSGNSVPAAGSGSVAVSQLQQSMQNVTNYPDENSIMNALTVKAKYELTDNIELGLGVGWSMFRSNNWNDQQPAVEAKCTSNTSNTCNSTTYGPTNPPGAAVGQTTTNNANSINILTPGYSSPNWNVGTVMASLKIKW
jgi:hypothetical protein